MWKHFRCFRIRIPFRLTLDSWGCEGGGIKEIKNSLMEDSVWKRISPLYLTYKKMKVE